MRPRQQPETLSKASLTDASGRYRLEVTAGRYYIASGSVDRPTYYPGTTNVATARVFSLAAGGLVESIDFSSFVPPTQTLGGTEFRSRCCLQAPPGCSRALITGNVAKDAEKRLLMQKLEGPGSVVIWEGMVGRKTAATAR
jgi:hypothetical protein